MRSLGWTLIQYDQCPYKGETWTQRHRTACEHEGRDHGDVSRSQGTSWIASKSAKASREARNRLPLIVSEETNSANILILDERWVPASGLWENAVLLFKPPSLRYFIKAALANEYSDPGALRGLPSSAWQFVCPRDQPCPHVDAVYAVRSRETISGWVLQKESRPGGGGSRRATESPEARFKP